MTSRRILTHGLAATLAVALTAAIFAPLFSFLDLRLYDVMLRATGTRPPSGRIAIVAIDDRSLSQFGQWPWRRDLIAHLVRRLRAAGARVVTLDMLLAEPDRFDPRDPAQHAGGGDAALAAALRDGGVVLGYALTFGAESDRASSCVLHPLDLALVLTGDRRSIGEQVFEATGATCSLPLLSTAAGASGYVNAGPDRDGMLRRIPLVMTMGGAIYPSLALASVREAEPTHNLALLPLGGERARLLMDRRLVPLDERGTLLIRFRGARGSFPSVSAADVLNGSAPADAVKDRMVFVGVTALGAGDVVATPADTAMPGLEIHAAAADTLLQGDFIATPPYTRAYELLGAVVFGLAAAVLVSAAGHLLGSALSLVVLAALWRATTWAMGSAGVFLSPLLPITSVLVTLATLTAAKLRYERRRAESERRRREGAHDFAVQSLTSLVETRDGSTGRHARRTQQYARLLAARLARVPRFRASLTPEYVDLIARLAPLHDIGKVGMRDAVLNKPGPLSAEEADEMRRHPRVGHDTILNAARLAGAAGGDEALVQIAKDIVYTHHERWDGKGYPRGLEGDQIPIGGRIMALVDVYDALVDSRAYRGRLSHDEAVSIIKSGRGTHFDPEVVEAFLSVEGEFRRLTDEIRGQEPARP